MSEPSTASSADHDCPRDQVRLGWIPQVRALGGKKEPFSVNELVKEIDRHEAHLEPLIERTVVGNYQAVAIIHAGYAAMTIGMIPMVINELYHNDPSVYLVEIAIVGLLGLALACTFVHRAARGLQVARSEPYVRDRRRNRGESYRLAADELFDAEMVRTYMGKSFIAYLRISVQRHRWVMWMSLFGATFILSIAVIRSFAGDPLTSQIGSYLLVIGYVWAIAFQSVKAYQMRNDLLRDQVWLESHLGQTDS